MRGPARSLLRPRLIDAADAAAAATAAAAVHHVAPPFPQDTPPGTCLLLVLLCVGSLFRPVCLLVPFLPAGKKKKVGGGGGRERGCTRGEGAARATGCEQLPLLAPAATASRQTTLGWKPTHFFFLSPFSFFSFFSCSSKEGQGRVQRYIQLGSGCCPRKSRTPHRHPTPHPRTHPPSSRPRPPDP